MSEDTTSKPSIIRDIVSHLTAVVYLVIAKVISWEVAHLKSKVYIYQTAVLEYK